MKINKIKNTLKVLVSFKIKGHKLFKFRCFFAKIICIITAKLLKIEYIIEFKDEVN